MLLDFTLLLVFLASCFVGAIRGAARQVAQLIALVLTAICVQPLSRLLAANLHYFPGVIARHREAVATFWVFFGIYFGAGALLQFLLRRFLPQNDLHRHGIDRILGLVLCGVKFAAVAYVVLCLLVLARANLPARIDALDERTRYSAVYRAAGTYNLFQSDAELLSELGLGSGWKLAPQIQGTPVYEALTSDPKFKEILARPSMAATLERGDAREVLRRLLEETRREGRGLLNVAAGR
jgi:uncharacterized membrane protein required for colicin V production